MLLLTVCSVIIIDCTLVSPRAMKNCLLQRRGKASAPMELVCPHPQVAHCLEAVAEADLMVRTVVQNKFKLVPAVILTVIWGLQRMRPLMGEAPGRPKKACLEDVCSFS